MTDTIRVRAADPTSRRIALWERDDAHPGGEVMVGSDRVVEVAVTTEVARRLAKGTLVRVTGEPSESSQSTSPSLYVETTDGEVWQTTDGQPLLFEPGQTVDGDEWQPSDQSRPATEEEIAAGVRIDEYLAAAGEGPLMLDARAEGEAPPTGTPPEGTQNESGAQPLPEDLTALLTEAGYATPEAVQSATNEALLAIDGIGPARLATIRAALPHVPPGEDSSG